MLNIVVGYKREIEINIIKEILIKLNTYESSYIFMHGSYAKSMNRWHSDLDINILYDRDKDFLELEELLSVMLYKIFNLKGRDKIHSMMIYTSPIKNACKKINGNKYCLVFAKNKRIFYKCRKNYEKIFPLIENTSRNISDFENYLFEKSSLICFEWLFSFKHLDNKNKVYEIIKQLEKQILKNKKESKKILLKETEFLKSNLTTANSLFEEQVICISNINKHLKVNNMSNIYHALSLIRLYLIYKKEKIKNIDINQIFSNKLLNNTLDKKILRELKINIKKYMLFLSRIEYLMEISRVNFSSRESKKIQISKIVRKYKKFYYTSIDDDYEIVIRLNNSIIKTMEKLEAVIKND